MTTERVRITKWVRPWVREALVRSRKQEGADSDLIRPRIPTRSRPR